MFTFLALLAFGLIAFWFGADSRPGFSDGRLGNHVEREERWSGWGKN